ncbi:MAG: hypothetical protein WA747_11295 [Steroidobacteraceae bacterium]
MRFRFKAFGLHLLGSACALILVLGGMYVGWYRWPGWYLSSVLHVVGIVLMVDIAIGPTLTLIVANPGKPRKSLARDIGMIVAVQLLALGYGTVTLWMGRPLYYAFSVDCLQLVQASDLQSDEIALGQRQNPQLAPHWYSLPRWIWAPLPKDPQQAMKIVQGTLFGGKDVVEMPRMFRPWGEGLPDLRKQLTTVDKMKYFSRRERQRLENRMRRLGLADDQPNTLIFWGGSLRLLAVFDLQTLRIRALLRPEE